MELFNATYREPHMLQAFLPEVADGDKRIVLVDGEVAGAINRRPGSGEFRSNLAVGGTAEAAELTETEREICAALGPQLKRRGLLFVGIDVIGGRWLTEINVTSPTGIVAIDQFNGTDTPGLIWQAIERRLDEIISGTAVTPLCGTAKHFIHNGFLAFGLLLLFTDRAVAARRLPHYPAGRDEGFAFQGRGVSRLSGPLLKRGGGRGDKRRADAPRPPPYRSGSTTGWRGRATPEASADRRRARASASQSYAAAHAA